LKNKPTIREVCEFFWELESEYQLLNKQLDGLYYWIIIRYKLFNIICEKLGLYEAAHNVKNRKVDKLLAIPRYIVNSITKNPLVGKQRDILIFDHPRKSLVDGEYVDIYTDSLIKEFRKNEMDFEVIEEDFLRQHLSNNKYSNRKYLDFYYLYSIKKRLLYSPSYNYETSKMISIIENKVQDKLSLSLDIERLVLKECKIFQLRYDFYSLILKKKQPKKIYSVVSYGFLPLIAAAKAEGIKVIEIQHGNISKYHLGYSYPNVSLNELTYFPDELFLFGDFWKGSSYFPISEDRLHSYGFPSLESKLKQFKIDKKNKQIVFLSQGSIGKELFSFSLDVAKVLKGYKIIYKLHPGEFGRWKDEYPKVNEMTDTSNFMVVENEINLYKLLAESEYHAGVYSTAIYEGIALKSKPILVDLPGIEYMQSLIELSNVPLIKTPGQFVDCLEQPIQSNMNMSDYFAGFKRAEKDIGNENSNC
jgi:hypothetical protein